MRISEDRYFRDLRPLLLAEWMLSLEARTRTICTWTGLSRDRVRRLAGSIPPSREQVARVRHRGRSPRQTSYFFRSPHIRAHASLLASYFAMVDLIPHPPEVIPVKAFPSIPRGERLCETYQFYNLAYSKVPIDFERAILLATALSLREELDLARCSDCGGLIVIDLVAQRTNTSPLCQACKIPDSTATRSLDLKECGVSEPEQMQLFEAMDGTARRMLNGSVAGALAIEMSGKEAGPAAAGPASTGDEDSISIRDIPEPGDASE